LILYPGSKIDNLKPETIYILVCIKNYSKQKYAAWEKGYFKKIDKYRP